MQAVISGLPKPSVPGGGRISHIIRAAWKLATRTRDIGADRDFVKQTSLLAARFECDSRLTADGCRFTYTCKRCKMPEIPSIECSRGVTRGSIFGERVGVMRWHIPHCDECADEASLEVTAPILILHGKRSDGYRGIPSHVAQFIQARFTPENV